MSDKKGLMEYGTEPSFPAITITDTTQYDNHQIQKATNYLQAKAEEIKSQYNELVDLARDTEMLSAFEKRYEPIIGKDYWVYENAEGIPFLSFISPDQWDKTCLGQFRLSPDGTWQRQL